MEAFWACLALFRRGALLRFSVLPASGSDGISTCCRSSRSLIHEAVSAMDCVTQTERDAPQLGFGFHGMRPYSAPLKMHCFSERRYWYGNSPGEESYERCLSGRLGADATNEARAVNGTWSSYIYSYINRQGGAVFTSSAHRLIM